MQLFLKWLISASLRLLFSTYRLEQIQCHYRPDVTDPGCRKRVLALWHEQLLMTLRMGRELPLSTVASRSKDGRMIGDVLGDLGFETVYGSARRDGKDKGGSEVIRNLVESLGRGRVAAITVDGSIGPRREAKKGAAIVAMRAECDVVPVGVVADSYWEFNTWDKLKLPKPFTRITLCYGRPVFVPSTVSGDELLQYQKRIGQGINDSEVRAMLASKEASQSVRRPRFGRTRAQA